MTDEQLAMAIGNAVLNAIKMYQPEPKVTSPQQEYMSAKQLSETFDKSMKTIRNLINEIREQIKLGHYPDDALLEGCGVMVNVNVFTDYLAHRKALKDPIARSFVPEYGGGNEANILR